MTLPEFFDELSRLSDQVLVVGLPAMTAMYHLVEQERERARDDERVPAEHRGTYRAQLLVLEVALVDALLAAVRGQDPNEATVGRGSRVRASSPRNAARRAPGERWPAELMALQELNIGAPRERGN